MLKKLKSKVSFSVKKDIFNKTKLTLTRFLPQKLRQIHRKHNLNILRHTLGKARRGPPVKAELCVVGFLSESLYEIGIDIVSHSHRQKENF